MFHLFCFKLFLLYFSLQRVVPEQINQILSADLNKNQLLKPFSVEHPNIPAITVNKYTTHAKDILLSSVIPAFQELKDYIEKVGFFHWSFSYLKYYSHKNGVIKMNIR